VKTIELGDATGVLINFPTTHARAVVNCREGLVRVIDDKCRHRGGPLHLCRRDPGGVDRCPWHGRPAGRARPSSDVSAVFYRGARKLRLIAMPPGGGAWPVKLLD
jgi:hypothetical protein